MNTLDGLLEKAAKKKDSVIAVACAAETEVLKSVQLAVRQNLASFILFDDEKELQTIMAADFPELLNTLKVSICHTENKAVSASAAVKAISSGKAHVLMKGNLPTSVILKAVLNREYGLRTGRVLSHVAAFEVAGYERLIFVTDAAMNIAPDLTTKVQIIQNSVSVAHACGVEKPIVAPLAAVETINPAMIPSTDAALLTMMNKRGQITGCIVEGPLALDNAVSPEAAKQKGLTGDAAGNADILLVPNIEAGNILYKSLMYFAHAKVGAVIQGAKAPVVLTSRADSAESKLYSLALALLTSDQ